MSRQRKQSTFTEPFFLKLSPSNFVSFMEQIPILSAGIDGWQLASRAFEGHPKDYITWQRWRSVLVALIDFQFAHKWFKILKSPYFVLVATHRQRLYFKPFRVYMSTRWTKKQKIKVILDTYRFILSKGESFKQVITGRCGSEIARFKLNDTIEGLIKLGYDDTFRKEGELVFTFESNELGGMIAAAAFSFEEIIVGQWVCRIACVQGHRKNLENYSKTAQKLMHGLRPKSLIIFAVQEFARHLGFTNIYGAGDSIQVYHKKHLVQLPWHAIQFDYNATWRESGGQAAKDGWYELPLIPVRKDVHEIKSHKRALYQRRYHLLDDLSFKIANAVEIIVT